MIQESAIHLFITRLWILVSRALVLLEKILLILAGGIRWAAGRVLALHHRVDSHVNESLETARAAVECLEEER